MKLQGSEHEAEAAGEAGADIAMLASAASIALSWYAFFVKGNKQLGMFVATWPPTILTLANHFKQREFEQRIKMIPTAPAGSNVRETIEELMGA